MTSKTKTFIVVVLSFVLGCVIGASVLSGAWRSMMRPSSDKASYREYFREKLSLDSLQSQRVDSLLGVYTLRIDVHRLAMQGARDSLRGELRSLLSDEQKVRYQQMLDEMNKRGYRKGVDSVHIR